MNRKEKKHNIEKIKDRKSEKTRIETKIRQSEKQLHDNKKEQKNKYKTFKYILKKIK